MRKLTATILFAALLLFSAAAVQAQDVIFTIDSDAAPKDEQVVVPVRVNGFTDVTSVQFSISWDANLIALASVDNSTLSAADFGRPGDENVAPGQFTYSFFTTPDGQASLDDESKLFELTFDIINGNAKTAGIRFVSTLTPIELFAGDEDATEHFVGVDGTSALPVELAGLQAVTEGHDALLSWETLSETNNQGFEVQQQIDGRFQKVGYEEGKGTTTERTSYSHRVENLTSGRHVFRLMQVDRDGGTRYSTSVEATVALAEAFGMSGVYPNPFRAEAQFDLRLQTAQHVRVEVFDVLGRRVAQLHDGMLTADVGHHFKLGRQNLASGMYIIRVLGEGFQNTQTATLVR